MVVMRGPEIGKLVPWNADSGHSLECIGFPKPHLIMDAQQAAFATVRKIVEVLSLEPLPKRKELKRGKKVDIGTDVWALHTTSSAMDEAYTTSTVLGFKL
ncbi:hypothetical protein ONS96_014318 [Cadophora gregata f. sp. sojae]|nr:hypothetical protein ONS96_014318 [Cadophora gregata f. sp. sojae]